jgi:hypothetical protein
MKNTWLWIIGGFALLYWYGSKSANPATNTAAAASNGTGNNLFSTAINGASNLLGAVLPKHGTTASAPTSVATGAGTSAGTPTTTTQDGAPDGNPSDNPDPQAGEDNGDGQED